MDAESPPITFPDFTFRCEETSSPPPARMFAHKDGKYYSEAKIRVWWDTETAPLPPSAEPRDLIGNIVKALDNAGYKGKKIIFWGRIKEHGLSGLVLRKIEIGIMKAHPRVKEPSRIASAAYPVEQDKDAISRFTLLDMFEAARLAKCSVNHLLISGNKLFLRPLSALKNWGHNILIARPSTASNVFDNCEIATTVWDWNHVAEGRNPLLPIIHKLHTIQEAVSNDDGANEANDLSPENKQLG